MPNTPLRAAIYARISDDREGRALGVERQVEDCRALADRLGWPVEREVVENDVGASARSRKPRPLYRDLLDSVQRGNVDGLLYYSNSRLTRRPMEYEEVIELVDQTNVQLASVVSGSVDLTTADGRMIGRFLAAQDAAEAERIAERSQRALLQRARRGEPQGGPFRPYGFEVDKVTHRPAEVAIILEVAERVLAGESLRGIVTDLNARKVPPTRAERWTITQLRKVITNPRLAGMRAYRGVVVSEHASWAPILDRATWNAVVNTVDGRAAQGGRGRSLLGGLLRCGRCGAPMVSQGTLYRCDRNRGCGKLSRSKDFLDDYLSAVMRTTIESQKNEEIPDPHLIADPRLAEIESELRRLGEHMEQISDWFIAGELVAEDYRKLQAKGRDRITALSNEQAALVRAVHREVNPALGVHDWDVMSTEERRGFIQRSIESVWINQMSQRGRGKFDPEAVEIHWK